MKNPTSSQSLHPRFWTKEQETLVMSIVNKRRKYRTLCKAFDKAARATNRTAQAVAIHYYTNLRNADSQPTVSVNVQKKTAVNSSKTKQTNMSEHNIQLVSFVRTLFTRLTPAERAEVTKNLV